ncbi:hypothetical protein BC938DRAFT_473347 [Jimgerdemannia flammicorona]|uniref:Uncharacterized protein n=1 Tax=Jimgerdemannia flammicorona TaxID=994334 RepID=A0A433Q461_9FUNG|nr:hypothetical protein BC938DRAFT_473347 [Jimgerdemannia flammicorona]
MIDKSIRIKSGDLSDAFPNNGTCMLHTVINWDPNGANRGEPHCRAPEQHRQERGQEPILGTWFLFLGARRGKER